MHSNDNLRSDMKYIWKMFQFMKPYSIKYIFGGILYNSQSFVFPLILAVFTSGIVAAIMDENSHLVINSVLILLVMIAGFLIIVAPGIYMWTMSIAMAMRDLKQQLFRCFVNNDIESAASSHSGESIATINTDADMAEKILDMQDFLRNAIGIVLSSITVIIIDWRVGIAILSIGVFAFLVQNYGGPHVKTIF